MLAAEIGNQEGNHNLVLHISGESIHDNITSEGVQDNMESLSSQKVELKRETYNQRVQVPRHAWFGNEHVHKEANRCLKHQTEEESNILFLQTNFGRNGKDQVIKLICNNHLNTNKIRESELMNQLPFYS